MVKSTRPAVLLLLAALATLAWSAVGCSEDFPSTPHPLATVFPGVNEDIVLALRSDTLPLRVAAPIWVGNKDSNYELVLISMTSPDGETQSGNVSVPPKQWSGTGFRVNLPGVYRVVVKDLATDAVLAEGTFQVSNEPVVTFAPGGD